MVIVYNTSPPSVSCSALALACRWVQNQLFDIRFMMAAKRPVRYTCTIQLIRDRKFGHWIKPLDEYDDLGIGLFQCFSFFGLEAIDEFNDLQYLASTKGSLSALVGGRSCTCAFHCTSLETFFSFFSSSFYVYSVETEAIWASFFLVFSFFFRFPPPMFFFCCFAENYDA